ncbi:FAD-dependent oxidoreductase [Neptunomonas phycophila]|uniref:FAD-dependent oxidoreductase n=1 Tax=Neptunomonas phycophila TaxID=1572645 RepID=UPI000948B934|nr:FAD-dependent oxidoreductase [Neptunomonas phycophila]
MIHIAIIGSGPSGCYIADYLAKKLDNAQIDVFDQQPTPFGLVRNGVAPDHLITKNITRQLEKAFARPNVRFIGGVRIESTPQAHSYCASLTPLELEKHYNIIVLATGATHDRQLDLPNQDIKGIYPSGALAAWYNGDLTQNQHPYIGTKIGIIGHGNVALDAARLLLKTREQLLKSDMPDHVINALTESQPNRDIYLIGRGSAANAHFSSGMIAEILELPNVACYRTDTNIPEELPPDVLKLIPKEHHRDRLKNLALFRKIPVLNGDLVKIRPAHSPRLTFIFETTPVKLNGEERVEAIDLRTSDDTMTRLPIDTLITAIGFEQSPTSLNFAEPTYSVGWCKNGAKGVIQSNRVDAVNTARDIINAVQQSVPCDKIGYHGIKAILDTQLVLITSFSDWKRIDEHERNAATEDRPRKKITDYATLTALINAGK